jgi:CRISPR-associated protein Csm4
MREYRLRIAPTGSLGTPFYADTLWGHICWAVRYSKWNGTTGLAKLREFLDQYAVSPPLLVSDGFPSGHLPIPILPSVTHVELDQLGKEFGLSKRVKIDRLKKVIARTRYLTIESFLKLQTNLDSAALARVVQDTQSSWSDLICSATVSHNTIDRFLLRAKTPGGFFQVEDIFFGQGTSFDIYLRSNDFFSIEELKTLLSFVGKNGYGRDASTGHGQFSILSLEESSLPRLAESNAFVSLATFVPDAKTPLNGYYAINVKYGRLGGHFATPRVAGADVNEPQIRHPFKKPILMFAAGSTFLLSTPRAPVEDALFGGLLSDIHEAQQVRHYAYAFPLGLNLSQRSL